MKLLERKIAITTGAARGIGAVVALKFAEQGTGSRNIRCNAIAPGFIETDTAHYLKEGATSEEFLKKIPLGRFGVAEEVANATLFLASNLSSYVTEQVLSVCGGMNI